LVMTTQGVIKGNTVHRKPESERWDRSELAELKGVPGRFARGVLKIWSIGSTSSARDNTEVDSHYERWRTKTALCEKEGPGEGRWNDGLYTRVQRMRGTHGWTACSCTQLACRGRLEQRLAETEEGRKRLADVEKRLEEGKEKKAKQAVKGLPDPTEGEVRSSVALGQPEAEEGERLHRREVRKVLRVKGPERERRPRLEKRDQEHPWTICIMMRSAMLDPGLFQLGNRQELKRNLRLLQQEGLHQVRQLVQQRVQTHQTLLPENAMEHQRVTLKEQTSSRYVS